MAGEKIPVNVFLHSVLKQLHTYRPEMVSGASFGGDCAILETGEYPYVTTCQREGELLTPEDICELLVLCANNLAAGGSLPVGFEISLLLPSNFENDFVKAVMQAADAVCKKLNLQIIGGQTKSFHSLSVPVAVVSGIGYANQATTAAVFAKNKKTLPNQDIVITKWVGLQGTAILAEENAEKINAVYPAFLSEEAKRYRTYLSVLSEAAVAMRSGVTAMHDASEGGIFAALWEIAQGAGVGLTVDLKKIPIRQETVEIAEVCGVNPYELFSGGSLVLFCKSGEAMVNALAAEGIHSAVVGRTTSDAAMILTNDDEVRYLDRPKKDQIFERKE